MKKKDVGIIYLDDEENNLISFQATFRKDYNVWVTQSPQEAAELIRNNPIHIVIADQKMPEVSGVEFLEMIRHEFQDPIRILLTGYVDIEAVIDAINRGQVFRYIQKPWNEGELRVLFDSAYDVYQANKQLRLKNIELEKAYAELEKFVYSASHDFNSPISSIKSLVMLAKFQDDPASLKDCISKIDRSISKLSFVTVSLIGFYNALRKVPVAVPVDLNEIWNQALKQATEHEHFQLVRIKKEIHQNSTFFCDPQILGVALVSLLDNALKYVDKGKDDSYVSLKMLSNETAVIIEMEDNGLGLGSSKELIMDLIEGKEWIGSSAAIPIFMIKKIADKMNGEFNINQEIGNKMTLRLSIPASK